MWYIGYYITYEHGNNIREKVPNYNAAMGIINQVFKPNLAQAAKLGLFANEMKEVSQQQK
jgi:hypothetical protein